jgi:hypothetical protein
MKTPMPPLPLPRRPARQAAQAERAVLFRAERHCKAAGLHRKPHKALRRSARSRLASVAAEG